MMTFAIAGMLLAVSVPVMLAWMLLRGAIGAWRAQRRWQPPQADEQKIKNQREDRNRFLMWVGLIALISLGLSSTGALDAADAAYGRLGVVLVLIVPIALMVAAIWLITQPWFWILAFDGTSLLCLIAAFAYAVHFQILAAFGFFMLASVCWGVAAVMADAAAFEK